MASRPNVEDPSQISRRATVRIIVAIALLVTAVAILGILHQRKPAPEEALPEPPPVQESISSSQMEAGAPPSTTLDSVTSPPTPPVVEAPTPQAPATPPATTVPPPPPPVPGRLPLAPDATAHPAKPAAEEKIVHAKPAATAPKAQAAPKPQAAPAAAKSATAPKGVEVQVGVFSDPDNAKQLQAKLAEHGIPSHIETHLYVGPFKDRAEADAAREKLKALGISGLITPAK